MAQLPGIHRQQVQMFSLETFISEDNPVRVIDAFVEAPDIEALLFPQKGDCEEGRPALLMLDRSYTLLKGIKKVSSEFVLIYSWYNLRRVISLLGVKEKLIRLKSQFSQFSIIGGAIRHHIFKTFHNQYLASWNIAAAFDSHYLSVG